MDKNIKEMAFKVTREILSGYMQDDYFSRTELEEDIERSSYDIIIDSGICTKEEYHKLKEGPKIKNIYDKAFDRGKKAAIAIILK